MQIGFHPAAGNLAGNTATAPGVVEGRATQQSLCPVPTTKRR